MRLPSLLRRTPFRLTLLFLALFAAAASAILAWVYFASASEARTKAEREVRGEMQVLTGIYKERGFDALNMALIDRTLRDNSFLYLLKNPDGSQVTGSLTNFPIETLQEDQQWITFPFTDTDVEGRVTRPQVRGVQVRLSGGGMLFVGQSLGDTEAYLARLTQALWTAMGIVLLLGLAGGVLVSRNLERAMGRLNKVVTAVQEGDLKARAVVRNSGDELDELGSGLNTMLDRLEGSMASIRHAGDAIAHDLRSPLTRMRAKLEVALMDADAGKINGVDAVQLALDEADNLLKTFNTVLAIARLQAAAGRTPDPKVFDAADLAADMAELYEPASEDKGLEFSAEIERGLMIEGNQPFLAQALANIIDNAIKYTPTGGAVMLRARRRSSGDIEFSVTDTGPGVPEADRERVIERFVRLDNSRTEAGSGLGLSLVGAVMEAHGGRILLDEGPGEYGGFGPGLRVALVLPAAE
ncbi:MAG: HAMP domain-containing histidine kinase [Alphaproteobacteria bacterium]|jgi:signal transduction histidine kinase|uniref:sensor histidine kinase n=1 Tax=Brevundimonas sp. TaxID=1871086 RepID=UPI0017FFB9F5|nr:HAMP domain-containing sensor histidine kinase [Brevundimonas sp.]MBA3050993.1 HAMP domain-containing histidine kinase [Brevundimonas sp.]MBU3974708.1 HAMP domain-containing histidine kinase [Alphaproteobacteria bacterium]MBU4039497.1 HAMP domain-containing histidine kinase [Alphaproteobacteria bacterium]MBU4136128.1 HAMP domain-containing histidine kinase [Alphaproteobacteria bacterium]